MDDLKNLPSGMLPLDLLFQELSQQGYTPIQISTMFNNMDDKTKGVMGRLGYSLPLDLTNNVTIGATGNYNFKGDNQNGILKNVDLSYGNPRLSANLMYDPNQQKVTGIGANMMVDQGQLTAQYNPLMKALQLMYNKRF